MNVCITGALGHIGSALIRNLDMPDLDKVYLVDNFATQRYASLFNLPDDVPFQFKEIDFCTNDVKSIIQDSDVLIHLAAVTDAETSFYDPKGVEETNKKGLEFIANLCAKYNCSLVFPSTTSVYGMQDDVVDETVAEDDLKPQSPYAESKIYGEQVLERLAKTEKLQHVCFRIGTIFGYSIGMRFHTAVNKFVLQAVKGESITVWKTALNQKRPYCSLEDAIAAFNYVVRDNIFDGEIYNVATTNLTVQNIIDVIHEYVADLQIEFVDSPIMNQLSYAVSTEKSKKRGFTYQGDLKTSLKETIERLQNINTDHDIINT